jgi:phage-related protein
MTDVACFVVTLQTELSSPVIDSTREELRQVARLVCGVGVDGEGRQNTNHKGDANLCGVLDTRSPRCGYTGTLLFRDLWVANTWPATFQSHRRATGKRIKPVVFTRDRDQ